MASLLQQTRERFETAAVAAFDKGYDGRPNFAEAERLGINLYVREKQGENRTDASWPKMVRDLTELERAKPEDYAEVYRFRSKAEGTPGRIKVRNPYMRLRRRNRDPAPALPAGVDEKSSLSDLAPEDQGAVLDVATLSVGIARLNESLAILIVGNLRSLNVMEWLYDQRIVFDKNNPVVLNPPLEMSERDVDGVA